MRVNLWNTPYNGGWVWFDKKQVCRFDYGRDGSKYWWCVFGFCGSIIIQERKAK